MNMTSRLSRTVRNAALALCVGSMLAVPTSAQTSDPDRLRAAIVFNVLRFIDFPDTSRGQIDFCVASNRSAASNFQAFSGRRAGSRTVLVRRVQGTAYAGCDVVYLGSASSSEVATASRSGRLTMGNGRSFIDRGGMVGLVQMGNQVRFEVNLEAAGESDLRISSRLIRLAARVKR